MSEGGSGSKKILVLVCLGLAALAVLYFSGMGGALAVPTKGKLSDDTALLRSINERLGQVQEALSSLPTGTSSTTLSSTTSSSSGTAAALPRSSGTPNNEAPSVASIGRQLTPRHYPETECSIMYSEHGIKEWREKSRKELCPSDVGAGSIIHQIPWIQSGKTHEPGPSSIEVFNLVKQKDGSWAAPCSTLNKPEIDAAKAHSRGWYDSGLTYTLDHMRLREKRDGDLGCENPIENPALFITRELGDGHNNYHELAQLFAAYLAKHIHNITDNDKYAHDMRMVVFDKHQRHQMNKLDKFFTKAFTQKGTEPAEDFPVGTCFRRVVIPHAGIHSIFWITFGHKPPCNRFPLMESFSRYLLKGTVGKVAFPTPTERRICYVSRGNWGRRLNNEDQFLQSVRQANPNIKIIDGKFGEGELESYAAQVEWVSQCAILAGAHGSGFTLGLFLPDEAIVVEIHPPNHGTFRGVTKSVGHTFIHVEASNEHDGNWPAFAKALQAAWKASGNFYHLHETSDFNIPSGL